MIKKMVQGLVTEMKDSTVDEIIHIFAVMKKHNVLCSLEFNMKGFLDPFTGIVAQPIHHIEYFERDGGPDSVCIALGNEEFNVDFNFELNLCCFKEISDSQIDICIANDYFSAWFNSGAVTPEGISDARNYNEVAEGSYEDEFSINVSRQERELIQFIRTLSFDDLLDATDGILIQEESAKLNVINHRASGNKYNATAFQERADILNKLADLLGLSNDDYRNHIEPSVEDLTE